MANKPTHRQGLASTRRRASGVLVLACAAMICWVGVAVSQEAVVDPLRFASGPWDVKFGLNGAVQGTIEENSWWNLAATTDPDYPYDPDRGWGEGYLRPYVKGSFAAGNDLSLYGGLAAVGAYTLGSDIFDESDTGRVLLENAFGGVRWSPVDGTAFDVSLGQQDFAIGNGMLIQQGAGNGFEWGAVILAPRTAWEMTVIARQTIGPVTLEQFYLDPNELPSGDSHTELAGVHARAALSESDYAGLAYVNVLKSEYPSLRADLTIIPNGREGMEALHGYFRTTPFAAAPELWIAGDLAYEWNDRIDQAAWGGQVEVGYTAASLPFSPTLSYSFRYFTGDDPETASIERFDSLYYSGSPTTWATGGNGSLAFYNSNVAAHRVGVDMALSQRDFLKFRYWYVYAAQLNSPIQFGQAASIDFIGTVPVLTVGVQSPHLSDDIYLEYTRLLNRNLSVTAGAAASFPGEGLQQLANGNAKDWFGAYLNLTWRY